MRGAGLGGQQASACASGPKNKTVSDKEISDLQPSDVCILVNRHDQANDVRKGLAVVGLPSKLISHEDIFSSDAAEVLQRFLDCLSQPGHSGNLRLVASSVLMQWNIEQQDRL